MTSSITEKDTENYQPKWRSYHIDIQHSKGRNMTPSLNNIWHINIQYNRKETELSA